MFCKKCGQKLKDGAQFCTNCGEKIILPKASVQELERVIIRESEHIDAPELETEEEISGNLFPFMIAGIAAILIMAAVLGYFILAGRSDDAEKVVEESVGQEEPEEKLPADEPEEVSEEGVHIYELLVADVTWTQAYEDCIARGGHLVRINSEEEYQAILQQISQEDKNNIKFWLGGRREADSHEYLWAYEDGSHGDEVLNQDEKYASYWLSGEPSYKDAAVGTQEMHMNMFYMKKEDRWVWNDVPDDLIAAVNTYAGTVGYICEYEE